MEAIILAGGLGTRLRSVVSDRPKPMALVEGKPFLEYVLFQLKSCGVHHVVFAVGYKGSMVEDYFADGTGFGMEISYAYEQEPLGTAGAIKNGADQVRESQFLVLNGDTFYQLDYRRLEAMSQEKNLDMALVLRQVPDVSRYGEAVCKDGWLTGFNEKADTARTGTINGGVYLMNRELLCDIPKGKVSLEQEMIPLWLKKKRPIGAFVHDGYFIDIGIPEAYYQFQEDVRKGVIKW